MEGRMIGKCFTLDEKFKASTNRIISKLVKFVEAGEDEETPYESRYMRRAQPTLTDRGVDLNGPCKLKANVPTKTGKIIRAEAATDLVDNSQHFM